ncbi:MAG: hypothetical protein HDR93_08695 [Bacteroides sp.]|nr:hypothetical protein [Bacteroides sp.]
MMNWKSYIRDSTKFILSKDRCSSSNSLELKKKVGLLTNYLKNGTYTFSEWTPATQPKKDGSYRIIIRPSLNDRIVLRAISSYLSKKLKKDFSLVDEISFAYQKGKGVRDALLQLKSIYHDGNVILKIDICKFFDNINKDKIIELLQGYNIDTFVNTLVINSLTPKLRNNEYTDGARVQIENGIPQGNAISAILSNLFLLEFDKKTKDMQYRMVRYADDIIFVCKTIDEAIDILTWAQNYLIKERGLTIHPLDSKRNSKTKILQNLKKNRLTYLGVEFDGVRLIPTKECQYKLVHKILKILKSEELGTNDRIQGIKTCIAQWCGFYAFTDISSRRLSSLSKIINKICKKGLNDEWEFINLNIHILKSRLKQNRKGIRKFLPQVRFGDEYKWLIVYE